jgi:protein lin-28
MSDEKILGTVKWFSDRKGFGFITPDEGSPISEDIFVHHTAVNADGFKSLGEDWKVEFAMGKDEDGKVKAVDVCAPGGGVCTGPRRPRRSRKKKSAENNEENKEGGSETRKEKKPKDPHWHEDLSDDVNAALDGKGVRRTTGTIDVAAGDARIKLGTGGYTSLAHAEGILAEGTFEHSEDGKVTFTWERSLVFDGEWKASDGKDSALPATISLADDTVEKVDVEETAKDLWGEGKADPKESLTSNGFKMRRVVLTTKRRG